VVGDGDSTAVRMNIVLMATALTHQVETVPKDRGADLARSNSTHAAIAQGHLPVGQTRDRNRHATFFRHFHIPTRNLGNRNRVFLQFLNHHLHDFLDMFQGFFLRNSPGRGTELFQHRALGVPAVSIGLDDDSEGVGLHEVGYP
jgi:hypothetical protein